MDVNPQTKDFFQSKTTWGMILMAVNAVLNHFHMQIPMTDDVIQTLMTGAGSMLFVWGQLSRNSTISSVAGVALPANAPKAP